MRNTNFKIGNFVKPSLIAGDDLPAYEIKAIFSDAYGEVLLQEPLSQEPGGKGYSSHYCKKVKPPVFE